MARYLTRITTIMLRCTVDLHEIVAILLLLLLLLAVVLAKKCFTLLKPLRNLPPSPPKLPVIGNLHQLGSHPHTALRSLASKYGPLMLLHLGSVPLLVVSSADAATQVLKTHDQVFSNRPRSSVASGIYDCKDIAFAPYGEYWRQVKSICVHHLLSNRKVQSFRNVREDEIWVMIQGVRKACCDGAVINLGETFASLTNGIICRVGLGRKFSDERRFKEVLETLGELLGSFDVGEFVPWLGWVSYVNGMKGKVGRVAKEIDGFLESVVQEHLFMCGTSDEKHKDFVDVLLEIQRNGEFDLDEVSVKALILDMFAAGTDTTYTLMEWTMSELLKHKNVMKVLKNELKSIARDKANITEDELDNCHYLKAVIKETLRLHPSLPLLVPRESTQDVKLFNYDIAAGTRVVINVWALGRDPSIWEDPEKFRPERFLDTSVGLGQFQYVPFGAGRRGCPGAAFALAIAELALANLVLKFEFALVGGRRGEDLDMSEGEGITVHRKYPLLVIPTCNEPWLW